MSNYVLWRTRLEPQYCVLTNIREVPDYVELKRGVSRRDGFPEDAYFDMDPDFPKDIVLPENVQNLGGHLVVSNRVKEIVERAQPPRTEYLPVRIHNHKGRIEADDYWIINPFGVEDCIDLDQSDVKWNRLDKTLISSCYTLVIDESRIDPGLILFRAKHHPRDVFVHRSLAAELEGSGATGIRFSEIEEEYDG